MTTAALVFPNQQPRQATSPSTMIRDCEVVNDCPIPNMLDAVGDDQIITGSSSSILLQPESPLPMIVSGNVSPRSPLECGDFPTKLSTSPAVALDIKPCSSTCSPTKKYAAVSPSKKSIGTATDSPTSNKGPVDVAPIAIAPAEVDADGDDDDTPAPPAISPTRPTPLIHSRRTSASRKAASPHASPKHRVKKNVTGHAAQEPKSADVCMGTKKKFVRFNHTVHYREIRHIMDYTDEQIEATWLTPQDYAAIKQIVKNTIRMMMRGEAILDDDPNFCTRGLEFRTKNGSKVRARNKVRARSAVLNEQDMQREEGYNEQQMIAMTCMEASLECRQGARARGLYDERMIQAYLHSDVSLGASSCNPAPAFKAPPPAPAANNEQT